MVVTVKSHLIVNHHFYLTHTVHIILNTVEKTNMAGERGGGQEVGNTREIRRRGQGEKK